LNLRFAKICFAKYAINSGLFSFFMIGMFFAEHIQRGEKYEKNILAKSRRNFYDDRIYNSLTEDFYPDRSGFLLAYLDFFVQIAFPYFFTFSFYDISFRHFFAGRLSPT
jgi:hypothetical protein